MGSKKMRRKKNKNLKDVHSIVSNSLKLDKIKINPFSVIEETKSKIGNFYVNLKKKREKFTTKSMHNWIKNMIT